MAGGAVIVLAAAFLTFSPGARRVLLAWPRATAGRLALAAMPWLALVVLVSTHGLWWTQRAVALRFFALLVLANWAIAWCVESSSARDDMWAAGPRRGCAILAAALAVLGVQGAAFGFTEFGCAVSLLMVAAAAIAFGLASLGSRAACMKMFVACAATLVGVAALEAVVRLAHAGQTLQEMDSREYARQFYSLTPPRAVFINAPKTLDEFPPALIQINSRGIRGPEFSPEPPDLLLIGDSMIEARQLPWEQTLGPRLQAALLARGAPRRVVAHGMRGWSPLLEWNWYLKVGRGLHPRTVILFFFWNDLWPFGDEATTFGARLRPDGRPDSFGLPVDSNWLWYKHVRVLRLVAEAWRYLSFSGLRHAFDTVAARKGSRSALDDAAADKLARSLTEPPLTTQELDAVLNKPASDLDATLRPLSEQSFWSSFRRQDLWTERQRRAAVATEIELQRFAEDVAADGARLVIVYVPNPLQVGPRECSVGRLFDRVDAGVVLPPESGIQTWLRGVAARYGIELLDSSDAMRAFDRSRPAADAAPLSLRADCHWSARGHQFLADYLADWLLK